MTTQLRSQESISLEAVAASPGIPTTIEGAWLRRTLSAPMGKFIGQAIIIVALLLAWEFGSGILLPKVWVSSPSAIFARIALWFGNGSIWVHLMATVGAATAGYIIGSFTGIASGLLLGLWPRLERISSPFVIALYSLPKVALAPLFVIFLGIGIEAKIALVSVTVYFLLLYNTLDGLRDLERGWANAYRLMGANRWEIVRHVLLPGIMPWLFSGLRIAVRYAFTAAVVGELIAGNEGIGYLIESSAGNFNSSGIFAGVFILVVCSVAATQLITRAEKAVLHWQS